MTVDVPNIRSLTSVTFLAVAVHPASEQPNLIPAAELRPGWFRSVRCRYL